MHELRSGGHSGNCRDVLSARTTFALVRAAKLDLLDRQPRAQVNEAGALRSVKLVGRKTCGINRAQIDLDLPERLHHVVV